MEHERLGNIMQTCKLSIVSIFKRILSSGGLFSVESMPGKAAATLLNS